MVMRLRAPGAENGLRAERPKSLLILSVSICLRLEIIAILSGVASLVEPFPATSCDAIPPGGEHVSAGKLRVAPLPARLNLRASISLRRPDPMLRDRSAGGFRAANGRNPFKFAEIS
jgi:hypothetical protein